MKREIDILVDKLGYIPSDRLDEYLAGKNLVRPEGADYERSEASDAAYRQARANVAHNMKKKEERKAAGKAR